MKNNILTHIKKLRESTGAGFMECKQALESAEMNIEKAITHLKENGIIKAANKVSRSTKEGLISVAHNNNQYIILELNCETDFVAKNEIFQQASQELAKKLLNIEASNIQSLPHSIQEEVKRLIVRLGENIHIKRFRKMSASANQYISPYLHQGANIGVLLQIECNHPKTFKNELFQTLAKDLSMHIAAMSPEVSSREDYTESTLDAQKLIFQKQLENSGKPEDIIKKILSGKMKQFFRETTLLEQAFIKNDKITVQEWVNSVEKQCNDAITIPWFIRYKVGEDV